MNKKQIYFALLLALIGWSTAFSQVGIGTKTPAPSSILDLTATNKGFLLPRIALTGALDVTTIPAPATSLLVYNTTTAGTIPDNVFPGIYNWTGTRWANVGSNEGFVIKRVACTGMTTQVIADHNTPQSGAMFVSYEDPSGDIIAASIKNRTAGVSFEVEFAANPPLTAFINYAYTGNVATIATGPAGAQGPAGPQGPAGGAQGPAGPQGETGAIGAAGTNGQDGLAGAQGPAGPQGATGAAGTNGQDGLAATVTVGTVTALASGATPTVTNGGTPSAAVLNFGMPSSLNMVRGTQATDGVNTSFTISNASVTASSVITMSYQNSVNEIINYAISDVTAGSFTVQFAAVPATGGSILYIVVN